MQRIPRQCTNFGRRYGKYQIQAISTSTTKFQDTIKPQSENSIPQDIKSPDSSFGDTPKQPDTLDSSTSYTNESNTKEDLVKKFKLKPSAEVGVKTRMLEKQRRQAAEELAKLEAQKKSASEAEKIQKLFEKLQQGDEEVVKSVPRVGQASTASAGISESWKFLFDETELNDEKSRVDSNTQNNETLDRIPGGSELFPDLSEYQRSTSTTSSNSQSPKTTLGTVQSPEKRPAVVDRWKDPKMKSAERDAFKALFSSLFEQKKPDQVSTPGEKMQSMFSNFNRTGLEQTLTYSQESESKSSFTLPSNNSSTSDIKNESTGEDPMQVLRRQLENLSKRSEPIYLDRKPKTSTFKAMESTVDTHDWLYRDPTLPQENSLFNAIRNENKASMRMRKELEEKAGDVVQVRQFVDELIAPFIEPQSAFTSNAVKPSSSSLDSLIAQAILAVSSKDLGINQDYKSEIRTPVTSQSRRSLHPYLGQAIVEQTRRHGLLVFIRAIRTESYKALLKSRWDAWQDGLGCLEILKEMQRNGALVDSETKMIVRHMKKELRTSSPNPSSLDLVTATSKEQIQGYGWGQEEQEASLVEMLNIIATTSTEDDMHDTKWGRKYMK